MELCWLTAKQRFAFALGTQLVRMEGADLFFTTHVAAVQCATDHEFKVDAWDNVSAAHPRHAQLLARCPAR
jgi:hypothetical protein